VRILYYAVELEASDLLLLTTDGLHGVVAEPEIKRILQDTGPSLESKCQKLLAAANEAGSPDNVTIMLMRPAH
jgi:serine/threonine protein phosphatase PrpC